VNTPLLISDDRAEVEKLVTLVKRRMSFNEALVRDAVLAGSLAEVREKLGRLREAGATMLFVPNTCSSPRSPRRCSTAS
jgi:hypothetical protein